MSSKGFSVYLHKEFAKNVALVSPKDLYAVLTLNWLFDAMHSGLPPELVEKIYDDHNGLQIESAVGASGAGDLSGAASTLVRQQTGEHDFHVLYVSVDDPDEPLHLLRVISVMNHLTQMSLSIYCSQLSYALLKDYANENIQFVCKKTGRGWKPATLFSDLVITFGPGALHFIRQEIPVMIIGPYGFGGMVSPEFLPWLLKAGWMGRPGGTYGEQIPAGLVQEELLQVKTNRPSHSYLQQLKCAVSELPFHPLSACDGLISRAGRLRQHLYDKETRWQLKPVFASHVEIAQSGELSYVKRLYINDTLAVVNTKKLPFFHKIDARTDCSTLYAQSSLARDDFWKYIYMFWEKKIILF